jgi:hypothetical protein
MVLSWTEVKALLTISSIALRSSPAEDARADAGDEDDPELLKLRITVVGLCQDLLWPDEGSRETAGRSSISMIEVGKLRGYWGVERAGRS